MKIRITIFCLICSIAIGFGGARIFRLESRLNQLNQQLDQLDQQKIILANWVGVGKMEEPKKNAALYLQHGRGPVIQIMDGQYHIANFAITVHKGEVVMQLIQDGKVRLKKLWDLTDESDFVRSVRPVDQKTINLDD